MCRPHRARWCATRTLRRGRTDVFAGRPASRQALLTNRFQAAAKVPLLIAMDAEWGLDMRLDSSAMHFAKQMTLGAMHDDPLRVPDGPRYCPAKCVKTLGVHRSSFAPVIDVNSNPSNPVIGNRSFGEDQNRGGRATAWPVYQAACRTTTSWPWPSTSPATATPTPIRTWPCRSSTPIWCASRRSIWYPFQQSFRGRRDGCDGGPPLHAALSTLPTPKPPPSRMPWSRTC